MNPIKSPHELLIEQAGFAPQSPGMVNTGQQMLMDQTGVLPHFADGGQVQMSPQDMLAMLMAHGQAPKHFAKGGQPEETSPELAKLLDRLYSQQIYSGELPPEPTFQAQPKTPTSWARDKFAAVIGEKPADRFFGTGSEGQKPEYLPFQFLNPVLAATETVHAVPETARQLHEGDILGGGMTAGLAGIGALPFVKPVKNIIKKIKNK
jgi:hypothetical protein